MVATYNKDGTLNYAISKRKDARFNNVAFTYKNGHVRAKGLVKDGDTTVKVGTWGYFKDGPGTIDGVEYSKSVSLSAFGKAPGSQHTNFLIKVLENGKWKQPVAEIYNYEKRFFITKKTKRIVAYTDSTSFTFKIKYKRIFPEISKKFFLLHPNEKTIKIRGYEVPFHLQHDTYGIVLDESKIGGKSTNFDLLIERYQKKYPKIIKVGIVNNRNAINIKELSHTEQKQLLKEIENDSLILFACNVFSLPFSEDNTTYDNQIYLDVDENRLNKCRRAIKKLGFDFAKSENGEVDYWYIVYRSKIVDEAFFEAYKTIGNFRYVSSASLNINKLDTRQFDFKEF